MIEVRVEDLAFFEGNAIIRPSTATLDTTTPLLRRLDLAGGAALHAQLHVAEPLPVGAAVVTASATPTAATWRTRLLKRIMIISQFFAYCTRNEDNKPAMRPWTTAKRGPRGSAPGGMTMIGPTISC